MKNSTNDLLFEIAKLWQKYGKNAFVELSMILSQDDFSDEVSRLLSNYNSSACIRKKTKRTTSRKKILDTKILKVIEGIKNQQPEKAELLLLLRENLMNKQILPTLNDIRVYLKYQQFSISSFRSRDEAIDSLFKLFMNMTITELKEQLSNLPKTSYYSERGLSQWSDIISRKNINENE